MSQELRLEHITEKPDTLRAALPPEELHAARTPEPETWWRAALDGARGPVQRLTARLTHRKVEHWVAYVLLQRRAVETELRTLPDRMQRVTNQARLLIELLDDVRAKRYAAVPWRSLLIGAAALTYAVSPADVLPDALPFVGGLDDMLVIAGAMKLIQRDLERYCTHKGYDVREYFSSKP